jgi:hypothetical protein
MGRTYSTYGEKMNAYKILVGKPEGQRRRLDNIKIVLREIGWSSTDWTEPAQDVDRWWAPVNTVTNLRVLKYVGKLLCDCTTKGF